jgi:hypothetical protein
VKDGKEGADGTTLLFERSSWSDFIKFAKGLDV